MLTIILPPPKAYHVSPLLSPPSGLPLHPALHLTPETDATSPRSENASEDHDHELNPQNLAQLLPRHLHQLPIPAFPALANVAEFLGVVGDDAVDFAVDAPPHGVLLVDGPHVQRPVLGFGVSDEGGSEGAHEGLLEDVE